MKKIIFVLCAALFTLSVTSCLTPEALGLIVGTQVAKSAKKKVSKEVKASMKTAVSGQIKSNITESILPPSFGINSFKGKTFTTTIDGINQTFNFIDGTYMNVTYELNGQTWSAQYEYSHNQLNHTLYLSWSEFPLVINMIHEKPLSLEGIRNYLNQYLTEENYKSKFMEGIQNPEFRKYVLNYTELPSDSTEEELYQEYLCNKKTDLDLNRGAGWSRFQKTAYYMMNKFYTHEFRKIIEYKYEVQNDKILLTRHIDKDENVKYLFKNQKLPVLENFNENDEAKFLLKDEILVITDKASSESCEYYISEINDSKIRCLKLFEDHNQKVFPNHLNISYKEKEKGDKLIVVIKYKKNPYELTWSKEPIVITQK